MHSLNHEQQCTMDKKSGLIDNIAVFLIISLLS